MSRFVLILLPAVAAIGATFVALRIPVSGSEVERLRKLTLGALVAGVLLSLISYDLVKSIAAAAPATEGDESAARMKLEYEQKIALLNAQVLDLQRRLANQSQKLQMSPANADRTGAPPVGNPAAGNAQVYWAQNPLKEGDAGELELRFRVYGPVDIPAFVAICDKPCKVERASAGAGSEGTELTGSTSRNIAGYIFKKPRPMPAGTEGYMVLRGPGSGGFQVTEFRLLDESEVPANLK